ncbi:hypothetical protein M3I54_30125 [Paraburkholderia sp. CNPSo 3274]|uniref:hypothetical protein n=1 Tax=Paraburkholderia sp. CNPSo 3274 TaxID=2940932 RepID=UPI0020B86815|nr:hypothetical protein [Paraburkholderia sp. CNPSo 3274]MCP3711183.1 hypothetical protein [Paraburkholderia sp. CNPSo 3274]
MIHCVVATGEWSAWAMAERETLTSVESICAMNEPMETTTATFQTDGGIRLAGPLRSRVPLIVRPAF